MKDREEVLEITRAIYDGFLDSIKLLPEYIMKDNRFALGMVNALINLLCKTGNIAGMTKKEILDSVENIYDGIKDIDNMNLN